jgi:hypothetical protein
MSLSEQAAPLYVAEEVQPNADSVWTTRLATTVC